VYTFLIICIDSTNLEHCIGNVNYINSTSQCDVTNSAHPVTMTTIRQCWKSQRCFAENYSFAKPWSSGLEHEVSW